MTRRRLLLILLFLLLPSSLLLLPQVRWPVYGWLRGEAFYQAMPTSYWRGRVQSHLAAIAAGGFEVPWLVELLNDFGIGVPFDNPLELPDVLRPQETDAVPVLIGLLHDPDDAVCRAACKALVSQDKKPKAAETALLELLQSLDSKRRSLACGVLLAIDPETEDAVRLLLAALDDHEPFVAYQAAHVLGVMGGKAKAAVPTLIKVWSSDRGSVEVRLLRKGNPTTIGNAIAVALQEIDPDAAAKAGVK